MTRFDELQFAQLSPGDVVTGEVVSVVPFGTFVGVAADAHGLLHGVTVPEVGTSVTVKVLEIDRDGRRASLTLV